MSRLLMTLAVYDVERDLIQVPLSDFPHQTVMVWAQYFQDAYKAWPEKHGRMFSLHTTFEHEDQVFLVECTFHTWFSLRDFLLGGSPL